MSQNLVRAQIVDIAVGMLVIASLLSVIIYYSFTLQPNQELAVNIVNIGDALWWSISTMTTVAYGDVYPVTVEGKVIAIILMFAGIGILWTFVAAVSSKLVAKRIEEKDEDGHDVSQSKADAAYQPLVMSPEKGGNTAASSKKMQGKNPARR